MKRNALLVLILIAFCSTSVYAADNKKKRPKAPPTKVKECRSDECEITHQRAIKIAQNYVYKAFKIKGRVSEIEYKQRYIGANYYEVEIKDRFGREYEIKINARTGKVIGTKIDLD